MADVAEKVKEFVSLPQSFLKEGTQVSFPFLYLSFELKADHLLRLSDV